MLPQGAQVHGTYSMPRKINGIPIAHVAAFAQSHQAGARYVPSGKTVHCAKPGPALQSPKSHLPASHRTKALGSVTAGCSGVMGSESQHCAGDHPENPRTCGTGGGARAPRTFCARDARRVTQHRLLRHANAELLRAAFRAARLPGRRVEPPPCQLHAPARKQAPGRARTSFPGRLLQTSRWRLSSVDRRPGLQYQVSACPLTGLKSKSCLNYENDFNPSYSRSKRISCLRHSALGTQHSALGTI